MFDWKSKLLSRKLWLSIAVVAISVWCASQGWITWTEGIAYIQGAVLFYVGAQGAVDLVVVLKDLFGHVWTNKVKEKVDEFLAAKAKEIFKDNDVSPTGTPDGVPISPAVVRPEEPLIDRDKILRDMLAKFTPEELKTYAERNDVDNK